MMMMIFLYYIYASWLAATILIYHHTPVNVGNADPKSQFFSGNDTYTLPPYVSMYVNTDTLWYNNR